MSENYVFGFKLNTQSLVRLRGSKDTQFVEGLLKADSDSVKEIDDLFRDYADRPAELLTVSRPRRDGHESPEQGHVYHYRRCLELLARRVGTELRDESRSRRLAFLQSFWPSDLEPVLIFLVPKPSPDWLLRQPSSWITKRKPGIRVACGDLLFKRRRRSGPVGIWKSRSSKDVQVRSETLRAENRRSP